MPPVKPSFDSANLYFITTTAVNRTHLFTPIEHKQIIAQSLNFMRQHGWFKLYAFVIMPNHIHLIVKFLPPRNLANLMRDFKKFTAKQIVRQCQVDSRHELLTVIEKAGEVSEKSEHKVWEDGYDAREIFSPGFLEQKLDYIHHNPCQPQWRLADKEEDYRWSSASFYLEQRQAVIEVDDLREFLPGEG